MNSSRDENYTVCRSGEPSSDVEQIKRLAKRGAIWVALTTALSLPLAYYRNWILGRIGETTEVIGTFATILLFIQIVITFVLFGGCSVVTNFLPKINDKADKSAFLLAYTLISSVAIIVFVTLMQFFPGMISSLIRKPIDLSTLRVLSFLVPIIVVSQIVTFSLTGLMQFRLSALLSQIQLYLVCIIATGAYFFFPQLLQDHSLIVLASTVGMANTTAIAIGAYQVIRSVSGIVPRMYLPSGFWRFSGLVHLNSLCSFAYNSVDQLFVLATLGTKELGVYFILLQCAQLISFVPTRIGQVMLASFSHLVASGNNREIRRAYVKLCRIVLIISTPLALSMILFSHPIAKLFGNLYAERHLYLILLAMAASLGALGAVNSMLIMAKERTGAFLSNNLILISLQLLVTILLLDEFGVFAVIAGRAVGIASGQIGLFSIVRWKLEDIHLPPPVEYWIALVVIFAAGAIAISWKPLPLAWATFTFVSLLGGFLWLIRFRILEIRALINRGQRPLKKERV